MCENKSREIAIIIAKELGMDFDQPQYAHLTADDIHEQVSLLNEFCELWDRLEPVLRPDVARLMLAARDPEQTPRIL